MAAVFSLVTGIIGCFLMVPSIFAIVLGHVALTKMKYDHSLVGRGMAIAGLVLGYLVAAFFGLVFILAVVEAMSNPQ